MLPRLSNRKARGSRTRFPPTAVRAVCHPTSTCGRADRDRRSVVLDGGSTWLNGYLHSSHLLEKRGNLAWTAGQIVSAT